MFAFVLAIAMTFSMCAVMPSAAETDSAEETGKCGTNAFDGNENITVVLQKWLLGSGGFSNCKNADLCKDGRIDIFDMIDMRRLIINS